MCSVFLDIKIRFLHENERNDNLIGRNKREREREINDQVASLSLLPLKYVEYG